MEKKIKLTLKECVNVNNISISLTGIYHDADNKVAVASDGHVLYASAEAYNAHYAGRVIDTDDREIEDARYPNWKSTIPFEDSQKLVQIDMDSFTTALHDAGWAHTMYDYEFVCLNLGEFTLRYDIAVRLYKFLRMHDINDIHIAKHVATYRAITAKYEGELFLAMPMTDPETEIEKGKAVCYNVKVTM